MNPFERFAELWFDWIAATSWQLAVLICLVAVANWALRRGSPRLRSALWLLVLVKVFLPPTLSASWSLGNWTPALVLAHESASSPGTPAAVHVSHDSARGVAAKSAAVNQFRPSATTLHVESLATGVWLAGIMLFCGVAIWGYSSLVRRLMPDQRIDEGPPRVLLEQLALELRMHHVPELYTTEDFTSPFMMGILWPRIVIPRSMLAELDEDQLRAVLLHELIHYQHRDTWIGLVQVVVQALFWFHPFVWWANRRIRHERECVCDEAVLRAGGYTPQSYSEAIVRVLTAARGRSLVVGSMAGVFERGTNLQQRVEEIMKYEPNKRRFGWVSWITVCLFAALFLPMAPRAGVSQEVATDDNATTQTEGSEPQSPWPRVVATSPEIGATGVDASIDDVTVTFDRDMNQDAYSWTGGPPLFPPVDTSRKTGWKDKRTCVLPVKLERGKYYRVGINSTDYINFRTAEDIAALPSVIYFTTEGASRSVESRVRAPQVVELEPENGAVAVEPEVRTLRVTFDMPMDPGMSWTGEGASFPALDGTQESRWSRNRRTCILPVALRPGQTYEIGQTTLEISTSRANGACRWSRLPIVSPRRVIPLLPRGSRTRSNLPMDRRKSSSWSQPTAQKTLIRALASSVSRSIDRWEQACRGPVAAQPFPPSQPARSHVGRAISAPASCP